MTMPLVIVEWEDSARPVAEWRHLSDITEPEIVKCRSVGFLIHDGKHVKALAPNIGDYGTENAQACGVIRIPTRCITKLTRLRGNR